MDTLVAARLQMTVSLAFHMVFAAVGIGMPLLVVIAEGLFLRNQSPELLALVKRWSKTIGLLFAVGAVSGTALSLELGLLWPRYMELLGPVAGHFFVFEAYAFFVEAIFIGLYLYGWDRLSPLAHWGCGVVVAVSGMLSGVLVLGVNAWMQRPVGFRIEDGRVIAADPWAVFREPLWLQMATHSTLACYVAVSFAVAGWYALQVLRGRRDIATRTGLLIAISVGAAAALLQPVSGDVLARLVFHNEPVKFAALEAHFQTAAYAPLQLGGWPDEATGQTYYAIEIPGGLSFLATHDPSAVIPGLDAVPREDWPNVPLTHLAFDVMVGAGTALVALALWFWSAYYFRRAAIFQNRWLMRAVALAAPLGFLALEAGWFVTEAGRQPWVIHGVMRTRDAVTPSPDVPAMFFGFTLLYLLLGATVVLLLRRIGAAADRTKTEPASPS